MSDDPVMLDNMDKKILEVQAVADILKDKHLDAMNMRAAEGDIGGQPKQEAKTGEGQEDEAEAMEVDNAAHGAEEAMDVEEEAKQGVGLDEIDVAEGLDETNKSATGLGAPKDGSQAN